VNHIITLFLLLPLLDDRPPAEDLQRFPPAAVCKQQLVANGQYHANVNARLVLEPGNYWDLRDCLREANECYWAWYWLHYAQSCGSAEDRRNALAQVRELIGWDLYYSGLMPPCVPIWRFVCKD